MGGAERRSFGRGVWFLAAAAALAGLVPLALVVQVPDTGRSGAWPLTLTLLVYGGIRLSLAVAQGLPRLFDFFFWLFCYVFMGLAPTVQMRSGQLARTTPGIAPDLDLPTALLVCGGVLAYEIGRAVAVLVERRRRVQGYRGALPTLAPVGVDRLRAALLVGSGALFSAYFVSRVGVASLFGSRDAAFAARSATFPDPAIRSIMYALSVYPLLVGIGALTQLRRLARPGAAALGYGAAAVGASLLLLTIINPVSSARYSLGTVLFALAVYAGAVARSLRVRFALLGTLVGLVFLFPLADAFRRSTGVNLAREGFFGEYQGNPDYDGFWQIANAYSYVVDGLVQGGQQALGVVLFWVPRSVWADKPIDTGILLANYRGYSFTNLSAPLWAEFLVNGGVWLLVLGFVGVGYLLRALDTRLLPAFAQSGFWAIVGAIFPVYMTILLRGSLLQATGAVTVAAASLVFVRARARVAATTSSASPRSPAQGR